MSEIPILLIHPIREIVTRSPWICKKSHKKRIKRSSSAFDRLSNSLDEFSSYADDLGNSTEYEEEYPHWTRDGEFQDSSYCVCCEW